MPAKPAGAAHADAIGDAAEAAFDDWGRRSGFATAQHVPDRHGIDRWFELGPLPNAAGTHGLDDRAGPLGCLAQIKGTTAEFGYADVALTVWERFAKSPSPCFFVGVQLTTGLDVVRAHLVHVGADEIAEVLRRLRQVDHADSDNLQRKTMRVRWTAANALHGQPHAGFLDAVTAVVADRKTYAERKQDW